MKIENFEKTVFSNRFAYLLGYFAADGSFYNDGRNTRFEFSDGTSVAVELHYSEEFLSRIKKMFEDILDVELPVLRKRGNQFKLYFRNKNLEQIFLDIGFVPGNKTKSITIPSFYKNTCFEADFWRGVMDGDGMVARDSRKISLESMSKYLIDDFKEFLSRNRVHFLYKERLLNSSLVYQVFIKSAHFKSFSELIMFFHPRKRLWMQEHLKGNFYLQNKFCFDGFLLKDNLIDYLEIFRNKEIFVVGCAGLLGLKRQRKNVKLSEVEERLIKKGLKKEEILKLLKKCRWKAGKGTLKNIRLPLCFTQDIEKISQFVRLKRNGIRYSRKYMESYNETPKEIVAVTERLFDIKPISNLKKEIVVNNKVLEILFERIAAKEL
ncbi:MAG: LAGLIDADG family homing endonuclease [archaeon]